LRCCAARRILALHAKQSLLFSPLSVPCDLGGKFQLLFLG